MDARGRARTFFTSTTTDDEVLARYTTSAAAAAASASSSASAQVQGVGLRRCAAETYIRPYVRTSALARLERCRARLKL